MEEIEQKTKKRFKKVKIFGIIFGILISLLFLFLIIKYYEYELKIKEEMLNNYLEQSKQELEHQTGQPITIVEGDDLSIKYPLTKINPRHSYLNSTGSEIVYITHLGDIGGVGNLTFNYTTGGYGYFRYLSGIITGWFTNVNATNINATKIYEGGTSLENKYEPIRTTGGGFYIRRTSNGVSISGF